MFAIQGGPDFTKALIIGGGLGLGVEVFSWSERQRLARDKSYFWGERFSVFLVAAVASKALAHYTGMGAAIGFFMMFSPLLVKSIGSQGRIFCGKTDGEIFIGLSIVTAILGYLAETEVYPLIKRAI